MVVRIPTFDPSGRPDIVATLDITEMRGPKPGFVFLMPWTLSLRFDKLDDGTLVPSNMMVTDTTLGIRMQGRGLVESRAIFQDEIQSLVESDDERLSDRRERIADLVSQENMTQQIGLPLPSTMQPPNDEGFMVSTTDGDESVRDSRGRRSARSTVRIAKEAWLRIAHSNRIKLIPFLNKSDPLWAPGPVFRYWMSAECVPFLFDCIRFPTKTRPRGLKLAIPSQEPWRSIAVDRLTRIYANERQSRRKCRTQRVKAMTVRKANLILGLVPMTIAVREADGTLTENVNVLAAEAASPDDIAGGLFTRKQKDAAKTRTNNSGLKMNIDVLRKVRQDHFNKYDPDQAWSENDTVDQTAKEEFLFDKQMQGEAAFERILLARFLKRNIIASGKDRGGPVLARHPSDERIEAFRQASKIMRYDPKTGRLSLIRDSPWVWRTQDSKFEIISDEAGNFDAESSIIPRNLIAWVSYLWPEAIPYEEEVARSGPATITKRVSYFKLVDEDKVDLIEEEGGPDDPCGPSRLDLSGWEPLAARILYGSI